MLKQLVSALTNTNTYHRAHALITKGKALLCPMIVNLTTQKLAIMIILLVGFTLAKMGMAFLVKNFQAYTQTDERLLHIPHCSTDTAESKNTLEELAAYI